ncbi:MAG TPA: hypothetical protein VM715_07060, partial [Candidatus Acidoferrum sp.]|nr:hypothetical protein [Candidatus Acidoferrum sp.]
GTSDSTSVHFASNAGTESVLGVLAFHIGAVDSRWVGLGFGLLRLLRRIESSGAEAPPVFDVVGFGQWGDHPRATFDLADAAENDLGPAVVKLQRSADFNLSASEALDITNILQVVREDDHSEWARDLVFAKVKEVHTLGADFYAYNFAGHTLSLANMLTRFVNRQAIRAEERWNDEQKSERNVRRKSE